LRAVSCRVFCAEQKVLRPELQAILPRVLQPAQYIGGELNMVRKDHRTVRGKLCMAFPDTYRVLGNKRDQVRQLGNAVTPPVMGMLLQRAIASLA
jgi:site-specific DNA-cytosine methylase